MRVHVCLCRLLLSKLVCACANVCVRVFVCVCVSLRVSGCKRTGQLRLSMSLKNVIIHFCVKISNKRRENEKV